MKKLHFTLLIFFITCKVALSQHSLSFSYGTANALGSTYLKKGREVSIGHQYIFKTNWMLLHEVSFTSLQQNEAYSFEDDGYLESWHPMLENSVLFGNFSFKSRIGKQFFSDFRISPFTVAGLSINYNYHEYPFLIVDNQEATTTGKSFWGRQLMVGGHVAYGANVRILKKMGLQFVGDLAFYPTMEIGYLKENLLVHSLKIGIWFSM